LISNCKLEAAALHSQIHSCKEKSAAEKNAALIAERMHSAPTAVRRRGIFFLSNQVAILYTGGGFERATAAAIKDQVGVNSKTAAA